jgi:flagellar biosynthesis/type III secretory pathway protein FliH
MILSDPTQSVSWRLNDLLKAGKKAKAFAAASWQTPSKEPESQGFSRWQPLVLDTVPEGAVETESLDAEVLSDQQEAEIEELPDAAEFEQAAAEEQAMVAEAAAEQAKRDAYEEGYQRGIEQGTADSEAKWAQAREAFVELTQSIRTAQDDMTEFYAPLKKLALHLAEQLVRGELAVSSAAIERLTKEALKDVEQQGEGPIVIHLHPLDMEKFSSHLNGELDGLDLRSDHDLSQGSVKVSIDDSAIEDLIEHRLEHLSEKLLGHAPGMRETTNSSAFDSNFANPVMEKVIEIDQTPEPLDNIVGDSQESLNDLASIDEQAMDEQAQDNQVQDNPSIDENFIDKQPLDNDSEDPDA